MGVSYRALDGGLVQVDAPAAIGPVSSRVGAHSPEMRVKALQFTSAASGYAETLALDPRVGRGVTLIHEVEIQNGPLRIWSGLQPIEPDGEEYGEAAAEGKPRTARVHFAGWSAQGFDLLAVRYSGEPEQFLVLLNEFTLAATPEGLTCTPKTRRFQFVQPASIIADVSGLGVLEIFELAGNKAKSVPRFRGTPVEGGEIFVGSRNTPQQYFMHVSKSTVSYLSPYDAGQPQAALDYLGEAQIAWTR